MSVMVLACIAVLAVLAVAGLAFYAIHRKVSLKFSARALRQFEISIEVASQSGSEHGVIGMIIWSRSEDQRQR